MKNGDKCEITCYPNHQMRGSATKVCDKGQWTGGVTECIPNCPTITYITDGVIMPQCSSVQPNSIYGCSLEFKCKDGFELFGSQVITCQGSGLWSAGPPKCSPKSTSNQNPEPKNPPPPPQNPSPQIPVPQTPIPPVPVARNPVS